MEWVRYNTGYLNLIHKSLTRPTSWGHFKSTLARESSKFFWFSAHLFVPLPAVWTKVIKKQLAHVSSVAPLSCWHWLSSSPSDSKCGNGRPMFICWRYLHWACWVVSWRKSFCDTLSACHAPTIVESAISSVVISVSNALTLRWCHCSSAYTAILRWVM